jgi:hypothetical protein
MLWVLLSLMLFPAVVAHAQSAAEGPCARVNLLWGERQTKDLDINVYADVAGDALDCEEWAEEHGQLAAARHAFSALNHLFSQLLNQFARSSTPYSLGGPGPDTPGCKPLGDYLRAGYAAAHAKRDELKRANPRAAFSWTTEERKEIAAAMARAQRTLVDQLVSEKKENEVFRNLGDCESWALESNRNETVAEIELMKVDILFSFAEESSKAWNKAYTELADKYDELLALANRQAGALSSAQRPIVVPASFVAPPRIHCESRVLYPGTTETRTVMDCR